MLLRAYWSSFAGRRMSGRAPLLGLPVQRAAFRPAPSRRSVEVPRSYRIRRSQNASRGGLATGSGLLLAWAWPRRPGRAEETPQ